MFLKMVCLGVVVPGGVDTEQGTRRLSPARGAPPRKIMLSEIARDLHWRSSCGPQPRPLGCDPPRRHHDIRLLLLIAQRVLYCGGCAYGVLVSVLGSRAREYMKHLNHRTTNMAPVGPSRWRG